MQLLCVPPFFADGRKAVVGTMKGKCRFYTIEKSALEYEAQLGELSSFLLQPCSRGGSYRICIQSVLAPLG